jgi:4-hydroxythreonine-4-phosphate dehydrogenase
MTAPLGVTMGDPAGIGPEIVAAVFRDPGIRQGAVVIGNAARLRRACAIIGNDAPIVETDTVPTHREGGAVHLIPCGAAVDDLPFGRVDARAGQAAYDYVNRAIDLALPGTIAGIVTAPLNKEAMAMAGIRHPGHTEILAARAGVGSFAMMLANEELRVVLVTIHVPLRQACDMLSVALELSAIRLARQAGLALGFAAPRVAVAGLNPHAGENGLFGREDLDVIAPAIAQARAEGIDASGPWPGDTLFSRARDGEFDMVVAQYHDQGLIPVKYGGNGVNVTLGLPFVRTSPDHGTAFPIAGTGTAKAGSMATAIAYARRLVAGGGPL